MKDHIRIISNNSDANIIISQPIPKKFFPGVLYILDRILGRVMPTEDLTKLVLETLNPMEIYEFTDAFINEFTYNIADSSDPLSPCDMPHHGDMSEAMFKCLSKLSKSAHEKMRKMLSLAFIDAHGGREVADPFYKRALQLKEYLDLNRDEIDVLYALYLSLNVPGIHDVFHNLTLEQFYSLITSVTGLPLRTVKSVLSSTGRLQAIGLIEPDFYPPPHFDLSSNLNKFFAADEGVFESKNDLLPLEKSTYGLSDFPHPAEDLEMVKRILGHDGPAQILFHGEPGTGKTELARCLLKGQGRILKIDNEVETGSRRMALIQASKTAENRSWILVADESDCLLNSEGLGDKMEKSWLVSFMDNCKGKIIWISNTIDRMHPAVARRFDFNLEFRKFNSRQRFQVWNNIIEKSALSLDLDGETIKQFSRDFDISAGGISYAISTVEKIVGNGIDSGKEADFLLRQILVSHEYLIRGHKKPGALKKIKKEYNPDFINADGDTAGLARIMKEYVTGPREIPLNLLFHGEPGTGKTEYAKYLVQETGLTLIVRRASDLVSAFVGETEANIARVFREAQEENAVLLLDEADTFFLDRTNARNSWEKTQTNELLTQMENYCGVLVCCTNHLDLLDKAVLRRFTRKIAFLPPTGETLLALYDSFFPDSALNEIQKHRLIAMEGLTPGDFFTVQTSLVYLTGDTPEGESVIRALEKERLIKFPKEPRVAGF